MQIKNIQTLMAERAIEALISLKLPLKVKTNYKIAKISLAIRSQASVLQLTKSQLVDKYGENGSIDPNMPNFKQFFAEWKEIGDTSFDIDVDKLSFEELDIKDNNGNDVFIPIDILRDLEPFIEK